MAGRRRGAGRGQRGRRGNQMGGRSATEQSGFCVCTQCGQRQPHERGVPCSERACPKCGAEFVIITPDEELPPQQSRAERSEDLLPKVKNLLTSSVMLQRSGTAKQPKVALHVPSKGQLPTGDVVNDRAICPQCSSDFPITPEEYEQLAECSQCHCEFIIGKPADE